MRKLVKQIEMFTVYRLPLSQDHQPVGDPRAKICWSNEALQNIKFQAPNLRVSGVRCQGRKTKTLKPETSVFVIRDFYSSSTPKQLAIFICKVSQL